MTVYDTKNSPPPPPETVSIAPCAVESPFAVKRRVQVTVTAPPLDAYGRRDSSQAGICWRLGLAGAELAVIVWFYGTLTIH